MRTKTLIIIVLISLISCKDNAPKTYLEGEYYGDWADTSWEYKFKRSGKFFFESRGHYGFVKTSGIYRRIEDSLFLYPQDTNLTNHKILNLYYIIDGDSCIIDHQLTYDYCKRRFWSKKRAIKYPQLETNNTSLKESLLYVLTDFIEKEIIENTFEMPERLVLKEYYQVNQELFINANLNSLSRKIDVLTIPQIKERGIEEYIEIEEINLNELSTEISMNLKLKSSTVNLTGHYLKENHAWNRIR